jgi:hypothetical protein
MEDDEGAIDKAVFITQVNHLTKEADPGTLLRAAFEKFGEVVDAKLYGPPTGPFKGAGQVVFADREAGLAALRSKHVMCNGANVLVRRFNPRFEAPGRGRREGRSRARSRSRSPPARAAGGPFHTYEERKRRERERYKEARGDSSPARAEASRLSAQPQSQHQQQTEPVEEPRPQSQPCLLDEKLAQWTYTDPKGKVHGPYDLIKIRQWSKFFPPGMLVHNDALHLPFEVALSLAGNPWKHVEDLTREVAIKALTTFGEAASPAVFDMVVNATVNAARAQVSTAQTLCPNASLEQAQAHMTTAQRVSVAVFALQQLHGLL